MTAVMTAPEHATTQSEPRRQPLRYPAAAGCALALLLSLALLMSFGARAEPLKGTNLSMAPTHLEYKPKPRIAIIIDDIGYNRPAGEKAISLPGAITYAVIPFTPFGRRLAEQAYFSDKEVIVHLPMESTAGRLLDVGGITTRHSKWQVKDQLHSSLNQLPFAVGFNNHMGSMLTADEKAMTWIMEEVSSTPLFFIDSMTNPHSIAHETANAHGVPSLRRDVFLDADPHPKRIEKAFNQLVRIAKRMGSAIAIAHPYPTTLEFLDSELGNINEYGVRLVSVSELVTGQKAKPIQLADNDTEPKLSQPVKTTKPAWNHEKIIDKLADLPSPVSQRLNFF